MVQKRPIQRDGSKETDPNRRVQINWSKKTEWSKLVQYGPKSTQKVSKWVRHNQVSWSSFLVKTRPRPKTKLPKLVEIVPDMYPDLLFGDMY